MSTGIIKKKNYLYHKKKIACLPVKKKKKELSELLK